MKFVQEEFSYILERKKSKFIAHICPYNQFDSMMKILKEKHPKAKHFVYAYRFLNEFNQVIENSSDDGEPKGTGGKPSLNVLSKANIINSAVVIVRYFGGIKLGTGGLFKAYSDAVNLVCDRSRFIAYENLEIKELIANYNKLAKVEYELKKLGIKILNKEFDIDVKLKLQATKEKFKMYGI